MSTIVPRLRNELQTNSSAVEQTAVLFFSRTATSESKHKFLAGANQKANKQLLGELISQTKSILKQSKLPVFHISEAQQTGTTFGERLTNAMTDVFNSGYDNLIVVGNDTPNLSVGLLKRAELALRSSNVAIASDNNGGISLLGIKRDFFDSNSLSHLPWQTVGLLGTFSEWAISECAKISLIGNLRDINSTADSFRFLQSTIHQTQGRFTQLLSSLFGKASFQTSRAIEFYVAITRGCASLRAPPQLY